MRTVESIVEVERRDFDPRLRPESGSGWLTAGRRQLQEVMRRAHQRPLDGDLADPSQEELAKSPALLDLTEHGLDRLLPQSVTTTASTPTKLLPHGIGAAALRKRVFCSAVMRASKRAVLALWLSEVSSVCRDAIFFSGEMIVRRYAVHVKSFKKVFKVFYLL